MEVYSTTLKSGVQHGSLEYNMEVYSMYNMEVWQLFVDL
jgi:hypothetical protein